VARICDVLGFEGIEAGLASGRISVRERDSWAGVVPREELSTVQPSEGMLEKIQWILLIKYVNILKE
jgi:hypothetical protein